MKIQGGPEELATFIRTLNDEPIYLIQERPREVHVAPRPPRQPKPIPRERPAENVATAWLVFALIAAAGLALITAWH